jgi:hypothetical protein
MNGNLRMPTEPTDRELELARRLDALEAQATRPVIAGGGLLCAIVNGIIARVPPKLITMAVVVFLAWNGWDYFNRWQQLSAETQKLEAKAAALAADADAKGLNIDGDPLQTRKMIADIATLRAEIARTRAEADKTQAEADAQNQKIGEIKIAVLQKEAEVAALEAEADGTIEQLKTTVRYIRALDNPLWKTYEKFIGAFYNGVSQAGSDYGDETRK